MQFDELREHVFDHSLGLRRLMNEKGNLPLLSYIKEQHGSAPAVSRERQQEVFVVVEKEISRLLGSDIAARAMPEFFKHYAVSTGDHHHPAIHPFSVSSALVQSFALQEEQCSCIFVFSCAGISMNNSSYPRSLMFHAPTLLEHRIPLMSLAYRMFPVHGMRGMTSAERINAKKYIVKLSDIFASQKEALTSLLDSVYAEQNLFSFHYFSEQLTRTNHALWQQYPGQEKMDLIFLPQEDLVSELLLTYHLDHDTLLSRLLTDDIYIDQFEKQFDGIRGASSFKENKGTILLWAIRDGERLALRRQGNALVSLDQTYRVELVGASIAEKLRTKELMPNMALSFVVLCFYYGIDCGGGFLQVSYLGELKAAYLRFIQALGVSEEETRHVESLATSRMTFGYSFLNLAAGSASVVASGLDLLLYGDKETLRVLNELVRTVRLCDALDQLIPLYYTIVTHTPSPLPAPVFPYRPALYV